MRYVVLSIIILSAASACAATLDQISNSTFHAIVGNNSCGTVFLVKDCHSLYMVTAGHVMAEAMSEDEFKFDIVVRTGNDVSVDTATRTSIDIDTPSGLSMVYTDAKHDVSVVKLIGMDWLASDAIDLDDIMSCDEILSNHSILTDVVSFGFPESRSSSNLVHPIVRKGYIMHHALEISDKNPACSLDMPIRPGSSGSPIYSKIDGKWKLFAIAVRSETLNKDARKEHLGITIAAYASYARSAIDFLNSQVMSGERIHDVNTKYSKARRRATELLKRGKKRRE